MQKEGRLASNHGQVEYLATMKYIHDVIGCSEKKKILEVGAGTGRYSIALAQEGHQVDALEYVTALPVDENGLTNPYEGVSYEEYERVVLPELMMHKNPINMPDWFVPVILDIVLKKRFVVKAMALRD
ncbi:MAG: hypothetical protein HDR22_04350 [Lachnospiraceae bacterium]|nr:hypothetical protein [Lachnospiraceae bacterium]